MECSPMNTVFPPVAMARCQNPFGLTDGSGGREPSATRLGMVA